MKASLKDLKDQLRTGRDALHTVQIDGGDQEEGGKLSTVYLLAFFPPESRSSFLHSNSLSRAFSLTPSLSDISFIWPLPPSSAHFIFSFLTPKPKPRQAAGWIMSGRGNFGPLQHKADQRRRQTAGPRELKMTGFLLFLPGQASRTLQMEFTNLTHENSGARGKKKKQKKQRQQMDLFTSGMSCHPLSEN